MDLLIDWHRHAKRQGPGGDEQTRLALALAGAELSSVRCVADIGCGTGASTRVLAEELDADIYAVDALKPFCATLKQRLGPATFREGLLGKSGLRRAALFRASRGHVGR